MSDLILGLALMAITSGILFILGCWLGRTLTKLKAMLSAIAVVVGVLAYVALLSDSLLLTVILPYSNLVVVGNWIPLLTSFLAGLAWSLIPRQQADSSGEVEWVSREAESELPVSPSLIEGTGGLSSRSGPPVSVAVQLRRLAVVGLLQVVGWVAVVRPLWGTSPRCQDRWEGDICVQTTDSTCTAACAATLLKAHGIDASEQEMATLCLTRNGGTLWQGLYRGLKLKTAGTPWDVAIVHGSFDVLRALDDRNPAILAAGIPRNGKAARIYTERYGWTPGEWHSVLFFNFRGNGLVAMGDPTPGIGRENWSEDDLRILWVGRGMRLVPRAEPERDLGS